MRFSDIFVTLALCWAAVAAVSTQGLYDLIQRRLPNNTGDFVFELNEASTPSNSSQLSNDEYIISTSTNSSIVIQGNSLSALATGLRKYLTDVAHVDLYWFIGSRLNEAANPLPRPNATISGKSIVPWRYYFNTGMRSFYILPSLFLRSDCPSGK